MLVHYFGYLLVLKRFMFHNVTPAIGSVRVRLWQSYFNDTCWHVLYPMLKKIGLFSLAAFAKASFPQGYQSTLNNLGKKKQDKYVVEKQKKILGSTNVADTLQDYELVLVMRVKGPA